MIEDALPSGVFCDMSCSLRVMSPPSTHVKDREPAVQKV